MADLKGMSPARRAYEEKQAKKAGKSIDAWLAQKQKRQAEAKTAPAATVPKKQGFLSRLIERANKPL